MDANLLASGALSDASARPQAPDRKRQTSRWVPNALGIGGGGSGCMESAIRSARPEGGCQTR
eukprot:365988-Chlamydomonas_euryale.AAC.2